MLRRFPFLLGVLAVMSLAMVFVMWAAHLARAQEITVKPRPAMSSLVMPLSETEARMRHNALGKFPADLEIPYHVLALGKELLLTVPERPAVVILAFDGDTLRGYGALSENIGVRDSCGYPPKTYFRNRIGMSLFWLDNAKDTKEALEAVAGRYVEATTEGRMARVLLRQIAKTIEELRYDIHVSHWFADEHMVYPPCPMTPATEPKPEERLPWPRDNAAIEGIIRSLILRDQVSDIVFMQTDTAGTKNTRCFPYWLMHAATRILTWDLIELSSKADNPDDYAARITDTIQPRLSRMYRRAQQLDCLSAHPHSGALNEQSMETHRVLAAIGGTTVANTASQMIAQWFLQEAHGNE